MGSVIQLSRHRPAIPNSQPIPAPRNHEDESWRSLVVLVMVFTLTAIAMSVSVVIAGSNSWAEAIPLIVFVVVFALTKVFLANALFYVMIRSDAHSEAVAAEASKAKAAGLVIRRPRMPPGFNQLKVAGIRPRKGGQSSSVRLAILPRAKPKGSPPRRTDR
jgi:membrane glycosyltransferase